MTCFARRHIWYHNCSCSKITTLRTHCPLWMWENGWAIFRNKNVPKSENIISNSNNPKIRQSIHTTAKLTLISFHTYIDFDAFTWRQFTCFKLYKVKWFQLQKFRWNPTHLLRSPFTTLLRKEKVQTSLYKYRNKHASDYSRIKGARTSNQHNTEEAKLLSQSLVSGL